MHVVYNNVFCRSWGPLSQLMSVSGKLPLLKILLVQQGVYSETALTASLPQSAVSQAAAVTLQCWPATARVL